MMLPFYVLLTVVVVEAIVLLIAMWPDKPPRQRTTPNAERLARRIERRRAEIHQTQIPNGGNAS